MHKFPKFVALDLSVCFREVRRLHLTDERGYGELLNQCFDHLSECTPVNDLLHSDRVPGLNDSMVLGFPKMATNGQLAQLTMAFSALYVGIVRELLRLGFADYVAQTGSFDYVLHSVRSDNNVILRRLSNQELPHYG